MAIVSKPTFQARPIPIPMGFLPDGPPPAVINLRPFKILVFILSYIINFLVVQFLGSGVALGELKKIPRGATKGIAQGEPLVPIQDPIPPNAFNRFLVFRMVSLLVISMSILSLALSIPRVFLTFDTATAVNILSDSQTKPGAGVPAGVGACVLTPATVNLFYNVFLPRADQCESSLFASLYGSL